VRTPEYKIVEDFLDFLVRDCEQAAILISTTDKNDPSYNDALDYKCSSERYLQQFTAMIQNNQMPFDMKTKKLL